jgi:hypothetical protein
MSMFGRVVVLTVALTGVLAGAAAAQTGTSPSQGVSFLGRSAFHMTADYLSGKDPRFVFATNFGGDLDLIDYGAGRFTFAANYEAVLGREFRRFDPTQGNYALEGALSVRRRPLEFAAVLYHQSRHLSDRPKRAPIDWNSVGLRVNADARRGRLAGDAVGNVRGVLTKSFVDYRWEADATGRLRYELAAPVLLIASGGGRWVGTDGSRGRGTQSGGRIEGGVRFEGAKAAFELFVAAERRIDPYPLEFGHVTWRMVGLRMLSR